ncbi:MAG: T9SS type A sorting domain-containing protein, partial [Bacteroidales bacterium]|nr:T9SS type A sorting domain-containing protein [Bacteroidales bacterium]
TSTDIDISNLGNGIYFILATDNNGNKKTAKFIKN